MTMKRRGYDAVAAAQLFDERVPLRGRGALECRHTVVGVGLAHSASGVCLITVAPEGQ